VIEPVRSNRGVVSFRKADTDAKAPRRRATSKYSRYVVALLFVVSFASYLDRSVIAIFVEPIKHAMALSDTRLGMLTGFAFAGIFAIAGVPLGWFADRGNRRNILAVAVGIWSLMTAACGTATSYMSLFLFQMGIGLGEAGGIATIFSLVADYVGPARRAFAFGLISAGSTLGVVGALLIGGLAAHALGWRAAFIVVGLPGLILALLVAFTIREPARGSTDHVVMEPNKESLSKTIRELLARPSLIHIIAGGAISGVVNGVLIWLPAFFARVHGMSMVEIGLKLLIFQGIGSLIGTLGGGWICDRLYTRDARWQPWFAGCTMLLAAPAFAVSFLVTDAWVSMIFLVPAFALRFACLGPYYAGLQNVAGPTRRSTAAALSMIVNIIIGTGLGPFLVGASSDALSALHQPDALRWALCATLPFVVWGGLHFLWAARSLRQDIELAHQPA
jgi:predicted MFS family arabinose efflux permease